MKMRLSRKASACQGLLFLLAVVVAGCSTGAVKPPPAEPTEQALKVTLFRWVQDKRLRAAPEYVIMLSHTWSITYGGGANEVFERIVHNPRKGADIVDGELDNLIRALKSKGWDELPEADLAGIDAKRLLQMEREVSTNPLLMQQQYLWITVQTPKEKKTVFGKDALLRGEAMHKKFVECVYLVGRGAMAHTAQASAEPTRIGAEK